MAGPGPGPGVAPPGPSFSQDPNTQKVNIKRSKKGEDRIFDRFIDRTYKTVSGNTAIFSPTKGGSNTNWQNHLLIVALEVKHADGRVETYDVSVGIIQEIQTSRKAPTATIKVSSLNKSLVDFNAEKVKDGDQYYENQKLSFILNTINEAVFKDNQQNLPDDKRVSSDLLTVKTVDNKLGYWSLGTYPGFDGSSFTPSPNAIPMTAMVTNADRSIIYVATGGVQASGTSSTIGASAQANPPELWQYDIDENKWGLLATTTSGNDQQYAPIQELFYNTYDNHLYGVQWKDYGDTQADVEATANKTNWHCPSARIFKWNTTGDSGSINDGSHSVDAGNIWPSRWDFRIMYPYQDKHKAGPDRATSGHLTATSKVKSGELETHKLNRGRASVGNFTAYRYLTLPFGPAGQQGFSNIHEGRRATHWMHPHVSGFDDTQHPVNDIFGATVQKVPTTLQNGNTYWNSASGGTQPTGWNKHGSPTFSLSGDKKLTMATASDSDGISFDIPSISNNMTVYKLRLEGTNYKVRVSNVSTGTGSNSQVYGPIGMANSADYTPTHYGNGDYYFSALSTNAIPGFPNMGTGRVFLTANNHSSDVVMSNMSLAIAHHWDNWHNLSRQASENIPLTHYSKVIGATSIQRPSHQFKNEPMGPQSGDGSARTWSTHAGPHSWFYDMFDDSGNTSAANARDFIIAGDYIGRTSELNGDSGDISVRQPSPNEITHPQDGAVGNPNPTWAGQRNEDIIMEFNAVAQDRRNLNQIGAGGMHPLFGPNDLEDGIQPDNSRRYVVGNRNIRKTGVTKDDSNNFGFTSGFYSNEAKIVDIGPRIDVEATIPRAIGATSDGNHGVNSNYSRDNIMQKGNQGAGYASVVVQGLGGRSHRDGDNNSIHGAVRYTNGQRGGIVFNQDVDNGKGAIIFQRFAGTAPANENNFGWDPDSGAGVAGNWKLTWRYYKCDDASQGGMSNMPGTTRTVSAVTPHSYTTIPTYVTAGCSGSNGNIFVAMYESRTHSAIYTGSNQDDIINRSSIFRLSFGTGNFTGACTTQTQIYDSNSDASVYNNTMNGSSDNGRFGQHFQLGTPANKSRKFTLLHYNSDLETNNTGSNGLFGTCFRRDSILAEYGDTAPFDPCHEVFVWQGTNNQLKIIDHDVQNGTLYDAVGFTGFTNTTGKINPTVANIGTNNGTFYFRLQKATVGSSGRDLMGVGLKLCYLYSPTSGNFNAGNFYDDRTASATRKIYGNEGMIAHGQAVTGIVDKGTETEREAIFSAFDDYRGWYQTSQSAKRKLAFGSQKYFFKIDDSEVDPRVLLADFSGLTGFDAISKLAQANNMAFGFDIEKFFLINRDSYSQTHTLDAKAGDVIDIKKSLDNDIRNVISIQAFRQQVQDVEWEVTHVGGEEVLADETIYNGEFTVTPKTHREASVNLICTRPGRLIMDDFEVDADGDGTPDTTGTAVDAITNVGDRLTPLFKWKTHAPTKQVVCMKPMLTTTNKVHLNTTFANGNSPVAKGEIVIFVNQETFEQLGRVIIAVDTVANIVTLEAAPGFTVEAGTPLNIVRAHTGNETEVSGSDTITRNKNYGIKYSDEGVCVITAVDNTNTLHGVCSSGNYSHYQNKTACENAGHTWTPVTRLSVNNIRPFADCRITPYNPESYKHYSFLITTLATSQLTSNPLPNQNDSAFATQTTNAATSIFSTGSTAFVKAVDTVNNYLYLNGTYIGFEVGDILNAHYCMAPASIILQTQDGAIQPPPYSSIQQDLPEGLGTWSWKCDSLSDKFNEKDIINFKFQGIKLVKDAGSIYTVADTASIKRYGQRTWNFPDNRFIPHERVEYWATKYLGEFGDPKYAIEVDLPFDPTLTFTTPAGNLLRKVQLIDEIMFPSLAGFSVSGYLRETTLNVKNLTTKIKFRTLEKY